MKVSPLLLSMVALALPAIAQTAKQSAPKRIPPAGVQIPENDRKELAVRVAALGAEIDKLRARPQAVPLLPDVQIYQKAVDWALRYDEFLDGKQVGVAKNLLDQGMERAKALAQGKAPWLEQTGMVMRGYQSKIDGSIQPYGLLVPDDWKPADSKPRRLDFWLHGRNEKLTELAFLDGQAKSKGEFQPPGAFVCFLYGRFCCANKFAGEQDLFEAWASVRSRYPIDNNRVCVRGFSMGGGACWHFAAHHAGLWAAAAPGAGFAETAEFFHVFDADKTPPPWWEQTLWHWYDATDYAANLANVPLVAYSGEIDKQKQAADIMLRYAEKEGLTFPHIIGPGTAHKYHPEAKPKIEEFVTAAAQKGREPVPSKVRLTTYTLIYPRMEWLVLTAMERQWERADLDAELVNGGDVTVRTRNVAAFQIVIPGNAPLIRKLVVDGQTASPNAGAAILNVVKLEGKWTVFPGLGEAWRQDAFRNFMHGRKSPQTCGPIDHAFMSRFLYVRPTGQPLNAAAGAWAKGEMDHAATEWRRVFRGEPPAKNDTAVTADDIANSNLILWGDPSSNAVLRKIADKLPLKWTRETLEFGGVKYDAAHTAPILIFPNPLNPDRYVVINSGHTFREEAALNNANQTPKLPDWAIVDLRTPPGPQWPGLIIDAGFFDEQWRVPGK